VYGVLDWQRVGARLMIQHYLDADIILHVCTIQNFLAILCCFVFFVEVDSHFVVISLCHFSVKTLIGPILWGHSGPLSRVVVVVVVVVVVDIDARVRQ